MDTKVVVGYNQMLTAIHVAEHHGFNLMLFEDLNRYIEAAVLYDKIVLVGEYRVPSSSITDGLKQEGVFENVSQDTFEKLADTSDDVQQTFARSYESVFGQPVLAGLETSLGELTRLRISPNSFDQSVLNELIPKTIQFNYPKGFDVAAFQNWLARDVAETRDFGGHFYYFARALVYSAVAEALDMDYAPDMLRTPLAAMSFSYRQRAVSHQLYDAMYGQFKRDLDSLVALGMPLPVIVPPLTAHVLSRASSSAEYGNELLELRERFSEYRRTYREFNDLLRDPEVPIKKKLHERALLSDSIKSIIDRGESEHAINVRAIFDTLFSSDLDPSGMSVGLSLTRLVQVATDQIRQRRIRGRARALFDLWSDATNLKNYGSLIERTFGTEINPREARALNSYAAATKSILNSASVPPPFVDTDITP